MSVIFLTMGRWFLYGKKTYLVSFFSRFFFLMFRRGVIFYHRHTKLTLHRPTWSNFFSEKSQNKNDTTSGRHKVIFKDRPPIVHSRFHLPICLLLYFFRLKGRKVRNCSTIIDNWDSARSFWVPLRLLRFILSLLFFLSCCYSVPVFPHLLFLSLFSC
jgi:hypothetical protein